MNFDDEWSSCGSCENYCLSVEVVDFVLDVTKTAKKVIASDPYGLYFYKNPWRNTEKEKISLITEPSLPSLGPKMDTDEEDNVHWPRIYDFDFDQVVNSIKEYVGLWRLHPALKFSVNPKKKGNSEIEPHKGKRYTVDFWFSKPTSSNPNPLAVAKVHFHIHIPIFRPKYIPVNVTYKFEGFKSIYYTFGEKCVRSHRFQNFFIEAGIDARLSTYVNIFECLTSTDEPDPQLQQRAANLREAMHKRLTPPAPKLNKESLDADKDEVSAPSETKKFAMTLPANIDSNKLTPPVRNPNCICEEEREQQREEEENVEENVEDNH